ncbi:unnamed protein product [marine sediment metagenome]|uniref:Uncharacterized protein n=1 Tax=marine sediment metagenome TaxID=412755 RepID=X0X6C6_9ZZZZ
MGCKTLVYSRVTGFYSDTARYNPGKAKEFGERKKFDKSIKGSDGKVGGRSISPEHK